MPAPRDNSLCEIILASVVDGYLRRVQTMTVRADDSGTTAPAVLRVVEISREPVELYKILKFEGMVASGGQAKAVIAEGQVLVNGKTETQKRKKIVAGDTIEFNGQTIAIQLASNVAAKPDAMKQAIEETSGDLVATNPEKE